MVETIQQLNALDVLAAGLIVFGVAFALISWTNGLHK